MNEVLNVVQRTAEDTGGAAAALEMLLRVSVLLTAGMLVVLALRRSSAALRHLVWTLSLIGVLLIPLVSWAFPAWQWAVLPHRQESPRPMPAVARDPAPRAPLLPEHSFAPGMREASEAALLPVATVDGSSWEAATGVAKTPPCVERSAAPAGSRPTWSWSAFLAAVWFLGAVLGVLFLGIGVVGAWHVARCATPTTDSDWRRILRQCRRIGFRRPVEIRQCQQVSVPMTWGMRRPVILVPAGSAAWSDATKRSVLLHELGHIRRGDCLTHLLGRLACAVYWFHPLVWVAAGQLRTTSEQAADDVVLSASVAPADYAEHLLAVAGQMRRLRLLAPVALPMASRSDLEGRLCAILDPLRDHRSLKRRTSCALIFVSALLLIPCALLRPGYAQDKSSREETSAVSQEAPAKSAKMDDGSAFRRGVRPAFEALVPAAFAYHACQQIHKDQRQGEAEIGRRGAEAAEEFRSQVAAHWPYDDPKLEERQRASQEAMKEMVSLFSRAKGGESPHIERDEAIRRILRLAGSFPDSPVSDKAHYFVGHLHFDVKPRRRDQFFESMREVEASTGPLNSYRILALTNLASESETDEQRLQDRQRFAAYLQDLHDLSLLQVQLLNPLPVESQNAYVKRVLETLAVIESAYATTAVNMKADAARAEWRKAASEATAATSAAEEEPSKQRAADLAPPVQLTADGKPIEVDGFAAPFLGDFDGDGKHDLLVGQFLLGRLRIYRNRGSNARPEFDAFDWFQGGGRIAGVRPCCQVAFTPQLIDFDGDRRTDVLTGSGVAGEVFLYRRKADQTFEAAEVLQDRDGQVQMHRCRSSGSLSPRRYNVTALAYDWDADGDHDLLLGQSPLCLVLNEGNNREPSFDGGRLLECDGKPIPSGLASHQMADWDGDGLDDLIAGLQRDVVWYRNAGERGRPEFESPRLLVPSVTSLPTQRAPDGQPDLHHAFCVADYNADGRLDLLLGDRRVSVVSSGDQRTQTLADREHQDALRQAYDDLRDEPRGETRPERIERYRKLLQTWQDYEVVRSAGSPQYKRVGHVWLYQRLPPGGARRSGN